MQLDTSQEMALYRIRMTLKALWDISGARKADEETITINASALSGLFEMLSMEAERLDPSAPLK